MRHIIKKSFGLLGYKISKIDAEIDYVITKDKEFMEIYKKCKPYTMTSMEKMYALHQAIKYIIKAKIPGDFVECGVWKGGSSMVIALTLLEIGEENRKIYLYDTFEGMPAPTKQDKKISDNIPAEAKWKKSKKKDHNEWAFSPIDEVKKNMSLTKYPPKNLIFVKGKVEDTIPKTKPSSIALLRLDTDWYESTKHELVNLFPILSVNGVLIIDDYGSFAGSKKAVDEYFDKNISPILLTRMDYRGRLAIKLK